MKKLNFKSKCFVMKNYRSSHRLKNNLFSSVDKQISLRKKRIIKKKYFS